ncbi:uncharacterized protein [Atheta coriaria]|uniref:uncharacterized protein n=1 Tax=Dalotia coriaria TaxID=877792 RepID=UPI0031F475A8
MVSDKVRFDMSVPDLDDGNYKSYFARSMAVNSAYRENKCATLNAVQENLHHQQEPPEVVRLRKDLRNQSWNASNACNGSQGSSGSHGGSTASSNSSRRTSLCSNNIRIADSPVEHFYLQSQVNTLQWQLKETESSREMYRAVMRQVVTFLERAHRSLELLGTRIKSNTRLPRPQSEYFINNSADTLLDTSSEMEWRWKKKSEPSLEEIPPEKLSQEAYRLLRTAQSLLSTHEPDLAHVAAPTIEEDIGFLSQLAKEFPSHEGTKLPQRATSFSLCPKLLTPEKPERFSEHKNDKNQESKDVINKEQQKEKISGVINGPAATGTTFSRKYSLQLNDTVRRNSFLREVSKMNRSNESTSSRSSMIDATEIFTSTMIDDKEKKGFKLDKFEKFEKFAKFDNYEKSNSPPVSSVGSAEDESGFSSMNSFQEVGIPHVDHTLEARSTPKPHSNLYEDFRNFALDKRSPYNDTTTNTSHDNTFAQFADDIKLWETPTVLHKRWSSSPVDSGNCLVLTEKAPVLWV